MLICDSIAEAKLKFSGWKRIPLAIVVNCVYIFAYNAMLTEVGELNPMVTAYL